MEMELDIGDLEQKLKEKAPNEIRELIKRSMKSVAREWETEAKRIITDDALDTGEFANSVQGSSQTLSIMRCLKKAPR
jgi:hypothetical protein